MVSAGSTGAVMAAATFLIGRLPGVTRAGIASIYPTGHVILDVGANIECKPEHLVQFAVMGAALATVYVHIDDPTVGLLNIGEEPTKGRDVERAAYQLLMDSAAINFVGNVVGRGWGRGGSERTALPHCTWRQPPSQRAKEFSVLRVVYRLRLGVKRL